MLPEIKQILYATDLDSGSTHVFRYALSLAQKYGAQIAILHVVEPLSPFGQSLVEQYISHQQSEQIHQETHNKLKQELENRLELFCRDELCNDPEGRNRVSRIDIVEGQPSLAICDQAVTLNADLIVMGTHRHTAVGEALLGSTAHKVIHRTDRPTLLVRTPKDKR
jgi:nucleotide-binding universal stress UspA family protein